MDRCEADTPRRYRFRRCESCRNLATERQAHDFPEFIDLVNDETFGDLGASTKVDVAQDEILSGSSHALRKPRELLPRLKQPRHDS